MNGAANWEKVFAATGIYKGTVKNNGTIMFDLMQGQNHRELHFKKSTTPIKLVQPDAPPSDIEGIWESDVTVPPIEKLNIYRFAL